MNSLISKCYSNTVQKIHGWDYKSALAQLEDSQWKSQNYIQGYRLNLLKQLLKHSAENVPYYRSRWKSINFSPYDITSEDDLLQLPILTKEIMREQYDSMLSAPPPKYDIWQSSGSSGKPFPFRIDKQSAIYNTFAALARGRRWWGFEYGQPEGWIWAASGNVSRFFSSSIFTLKRRLSWSLKNIKLIDVHDIDETSIIKGYYTFKKHQPILIRAISSGLYRFCSGINQLGLDGTSLGIKAVIFTGETFPNAQRTFVQEVLNCKTICEYGCTELGIIGFECPEGNIHLSHDNLILEFLKDGKPASPGEVAELVVTNLRNLASPLIRYSLGDLVVPSEMMCSCGRTLPVIESVQGRTHDVLVTPDGKVMHGLFFSHMMNSYDTIQQYRVIQTSSDIIRLELVSQEKISESLMDKLQKTIMKHFRSLTSVEINQVRDLPTSKSGKTPWIISKVSS